MAKFRQPGEVVECTPPDQEARPEIERIVYRIKTPTLGDRVSYDWACDAAGARHYGPIDMLVALEAGVNAVGADVPGIDVDKSAALVRRQRERLLSLVEERGKLDTVQWIKQFVEIVHEPELLEIEALIAPEYPRYRRMEADSRAYPTRRGIEAARLFLVDWAGIDGEVVRGSRGCTAETLERIPLEHFPVLANFLDDLMHPTEQEAKNSDSPSPADTSAMISAAASTQR